MPTARNTEKKPPPQTTKIARMLDKLVSVNIVSGFVEKNKVIEGGPFKVM